VVDLVKRRVVARTPQRQEGHEEMMVVIRYRERDTHEVVKVDCDLSNSNFGLARGSRLPSAAELVKVMTLLKPRRWR
jgi:hypothetical protein